MTYTPEQLREEATQLERENCDVMKVDQRTQIALLRAHAAALEELARVKDALLGVKEYREKNPLGGPAKVFDAMADQIRAGDDFNRVIADYGWCPVDRAERAEAALAESERKIERLKYHADDVYVKARRVANGHNQIAAVGALTKSLDAYHDEFK